MVTQQEIAKHIEYLWDIVLYEIEPEDVKHLSLSGHLSVEDIIEQRKPEIAQLLLTKLKERQLW